MPRSKKSAKPSKPADQEVVPASPDWSDPSQFVTLDLRTALMMMAKEKRSRGLEATIAQLSRISKQSPELPIRVPVAVLLAFLSCTSATGTSAATIAPDVAVMAGRIVIAFTYTDASTKGCGIGAITNVNLVDATTGTTTQFNALEQLQHTPIGAAGATGSWFGKTKAGVPPTLASGATGTLNVTFTSTETERCMTCTPSPVVVSANFTVK